MRPFFAVVLLAVSVVATMNESERLRQPSSPPGRESSDDFVQGHVRGALTADEERQANKFFLNAAASRIPHVGERGQLGASFQSQKAVEEMMADQNLLHICENYMQLVKPNDFRGLQQLVDVGGLFWFVSTIAQLKRGSKHAQDIASLMERRLHNMWLSQEMTPKSVFDNLKLSENDLLRNTPAFAMFKSYVDSFLVGGSHEIQKANLMTYGRPVSDELKGIRLPSDADNNKLRLSSRHEHESANNPRKRERESDNNPTKKRQREFDDNPSKRMRESEDNLSKRMRGPVE